MGEGKATALGALAERLAEEVAPKLERLQAAGGNVSELREEVASLNESVDELAGKVAEVKEAVRAARARRAAGGGEG